MKEIFETHSFYDSFPEMSKDDYERYCFYAGIEHKEKEVDTYEDAV